MKHRRLIYFIVTLIIVTTGLASRKFGDQIPDFLAGYAGDTLWAAMVYFGIRFLFPHMQIYKTALMALFFSYGIEISQLYQAEWINNIRNTTLGALVLGHGFLWTDLLCYTVGVLLSALPDRLLTSN